MESRAQSSCRTQEDGDGSDRPLKKARFAWQVKGKHHPKNETNPAIASPTEEIQDPASTSPVEEHLTTKTNSCDSRYNGSLNDDNTGNNMAQENPNDHYSISSRSESRWRALSARDQLFLNQISLPFENYYNSPEDQYLIQWQTQQMIACCTDNIINRITDRRMQAPSTTGSSLRALNMAQFLNHLPGDNTVENEGILMAISAHGLRNNISIFNHDEESDSETYDDSDDDETSDDNEGDDQSLPSDPIATNEVPIGNPEPEAIEDNDNESDVGFFEISESSENDNHFLFMNAAVQTAIGSKGLTASGT